MGIGRKEKRKERREFVVYEYADVMNLRLKGCLGGENEEHPQEQWVLLRVSYPDNKVVGMMIHPFKKFALKYIARNWLDRLLIPLFGESIISKKQIEKAYYDLVATSSFQSW
jgi:hypothetical protein